MVNGRNDNPPLRSSGNYHRSRPTDLHYHGQHALPTTGVKVKNERLSQYFPRFTLALFGILLSLVVYVHAQDVLRCETKDKHQEAELDRVAGVQREVVERLARVEVGVSNLNQTAQENKEKLDKNGDKIDDILQLLLKEKQAKRNP